jgi:hypothetical protein
MPIEDLDIYRDAKLWLERYGDRAIVNARLRVTDFRADDDDLQADRWLQIIVAIEELVRKNRG